MTAWLDELNPAQREAVLYNDGPLLIVAGAGTGKTKTLACRVASLIERGVSTDRILLLTFTRRAAAEMITRAGHLIGAQTSGKIWGGTFHAIANRLLRHYGKALRLPQDFTVIDPADAADLMNLIRNELGLGRGNHRFPRKDTLFAIYSRMVNAETKLTDTLKDEYPWCAEHADAIRQIIQLYMQRKREQNVLDYDDLLLYWAALAESEEMSEAVERRFDHILVDEYQDTNAVQARILRAMRKTNHNICVVGDDAQSIYSFRAATVRNILDFPKSFANTRIVTLEQNYRSTQPILAASNAVMERAKERFTKNLWSQRTSEQRPALLICTDETEQSDTVCRHILEHLERDVPLHRQAVLFRTGYHSDHLEIELARRNIPFHKYGGLKFVESAHVKDMIAFLRVLENPHDEISWFRVLQLLDGIGPRAAQRIMDALGVRREATTSPSEAAPTPLSPLRKLVDAPPAVPAGARAQFQELRTALADCGGALPPAAQVERIRRFYEPIFQQRYDNPTIRLRDIEQLEQIAGGYRSRGRFITDLTLDPPSATSDLAGAPHLDEDYLILSTIHSAKGCEWDVVHVIHASDGNMPSDMAIKNQEGIEEERRLFYVALTRAKDMLYVYFPLRYYTHRMGSSDRHVYAQLTRFLAEGPKAFFDQRGGTNLNEDSAPGPSREIRKVENWLNDLLG